MKQRNYMIWYRPVGSTTFTPVEDKAVAKYTDKGANITGNIQIAQDIHAILTARDDGNEYTVFECLDVGFPVDTTLVLSCGNLLCSGWQNN